MEDLFERAFFSRVLKDYGAKLFSVQVAITRKNPGPKLSRDFLFYLRVKIDQFPRGLIGIEKLPGRHELAQTIAKGRLARGNAARDPDSRHVILRKLRYLRSLLFDLRLVTSSGRSHRTRTDGDFVTFVSFCRFRDVLQKVTKKTKILPESTRTDLTYLRLLLLDSRVSIGGAASLLLPTMIDRRAAGIDPAGPRRVYANCNIYNHARL
jgi:hypothetical protein